MSKALTKKTQRQARISADNLEKAIQEKAALANLAWRVARLERQVRTLSELVRDHAEDSDRLVRIVAEDHDALRQELLREHQARLHARKGKHR